MALRNSRRPSGQSFARALDRKSTRLNSSHRQISYAVFCLKKKNQHITRLLTTRRDDQHSHSPIATFGSPTQWSATPPSLLLAATPYLLVHSSPREARTTRC